MTWRTHVLGGISALWLLQMLPTAPSSTNIGLLAVTAALGALLPDLDAAESKIKHLSLGTLQPLAPVSALLHRAWGHRGRLHSLFSLVGLGAAAIPIAVWLGWPVAVALVLGYASHLALDACTRFGIPWLWPNPSRYHLLPRPLRFVTGSAAEDGLFFLFAVATLMLLLSQLPFNSIFNLTA